MRAFCIFTRRGKKTSLSKLPPPGSVGDGGGAFKRQGGQGMKVRYAKQGEAFTALLKTSGITAKAFKSMTGVSRESINEWEKGQSAPFHCKTVEKLRSTLPADFYAQMAAIYPIMQISTKERLEKARQKNIAKAARYQAQKKTVKMNGETKKQAAARFEAECRARIAKRYAL